MAERAANFPFAAQLGHSFSLRPHLLSGAFMENVVYLENEI